MRTLVTLTCLMLILHACNNAGKTAESSTKANDTSEVYDFLDDTIPRFDSIFPEEAPLDEHTRLRLYKEVMKDKKAKKLFDFKALGNDKLLPAYRNFRETLTGYKDSADERYTGFFNDLFEKLQVHEEDISSVDSLDVRTRLEIARLKSEINAYFAERKSRKASSRP